MFLSACVCLLAELRKNYSADFHKIRWKLAAWPRQKPLDFAGNQDCVTLC